MIWLKACPKCRGDMVLDTDYYGHYVSCIQCGNSLDKAQISLFHQRLFIDRPAAKLPEMTSASRVAGRRVA